MQKIRYGLIVLWMLTCSAIAAEARVSIGIGLPGVSIGINLPLYPDLVPVPGYPVYYAPRLNANYFFYDGMYWVYQDDNWYASSWYNGPWGLVDPEVVPLFILRVPVSYYRQPPVYFRSWQSNEPPRWGQHWGRGWEQHRNGWDRWNRAAAPAPAPLPAYQRHYSRDRYPRVEQQQILRSRNYRYQPRDTVVRQHFKQQTEQKAPAAAQRGRKEETPVNSQRQQVAPDGQRSQPQHQGIENKQQPVQVQPDTRQRGPAPNIPKQQPAAVQHEQRAPRHQGGGHDQQSAPPQQRAPAAREQKQPEAPERVQQAPRQQEQEQRGQPQEQRNQGRGHERQNNEERGGERNR